MQSDNLVEEQVSDEQFLRDVIAGLSQAQKTLPCQYFYDEAGSHLFEKITQLTEYYPTRTETNLLEQQAPAIAEKLGAESLLVEYGAGASVKTRILLDALPGLKAYVPIDVSRTFLLQTAEALSQDYPALPIYPVAGDFMAYDLPSDLPRGRRVGFFPGSTIGNLDDDQITHLFEVAAQKLGQEAAFLIGVDLHKSAELLIPAYQDSAGVTAQFNLNLLVRLNRELGANFDLSAFRHEARWNAQHSRIEMHLVSTVALTIRLGARTFEFEAGESIHTENSRKFKLERLVSHVEAAGWALDADWQNTEFAYAMLLFVRQRSASSPP